MSVRFMHDIMHHVIFGRLIQRVWRPASATRKTFINERVDHHVVLPRCLAAVHHGGAGTTHTVLHRAPGPEFTAFPYLAARAEIDRFASAES